MNVSKQQKLVLGVCASLVLALLPWRTVHAIEGGESAIGENVVTMITRDSVGRLNQQCSGNVIAPRLVVTAKHCFPMFNSVNPLRSLTDVAFPGSDLNGPFKTAKILSVITTPGDYVVNSDDLAIVITDINLPVIGNLRIATKDDIERFRMSNPSAVTFGYGSNANSGDMQKTPSKMVHKFIANHENIPIESFSIEYIGKSAYMCGGDSGGPSYVMENDTMVYIGPTSSGTREGCAYGVRGGPFRLNGSALAFKDALLFRAQETLRELQLKEELDASIAAKNSRVIKSKPATICVKGIIVKKVSGKNSKCPKGFKTRK